MRKENSAQKRLNSDLIVWIAAIAVTVVIMAAIFIVDFMKNSNEKQSSAGENTSGSVIEFPLDGTDAMVKLSAANYTVESENAALLADFGKAAAEEYDLVFSGSITSYLKVYDPETGEWMAEIIYFEQNADAKMLYEAMASEWDKDGEIRCRDNAVYMGYGEVLDALEK